MQVSTQESPVNHKRVECIMRIHGLLSKRRSVNPYKNIPKESSEIEIAENILSRKYATTRCGRLEYSEQILRIRITENKWAYLSVIKDFCTREIVAHKISLNPNIELALATLKYFAVSVPLKSRIEGLMHSDR